MPTTPKITPFLWFDMNAEEAVKFYTSIFKDSRTTTTTRYGEGAPVPKGTVMTIAFELAGQKFIAINGGPMYKFSEAVSFVVNCDTQAEIDYYWEKLSAAGGKPVQCGWLKDRFGLSWQVVPSNIGEYFSDPAKAARVAPILFKMVKLDMNALEAAARGK